MKLARKAAPLLDIPVAEFMRLRKNQQTSGLLEPGEQTIAVALLAELLAVQAPVFFQHVPLKRPQQMVRGMIQQFGV
jgi:hypothetical protein